jgi:hypothetical protein
VTAAGLLATLVATALASAPEPEPVVPPTLLRPLSLPAVIPARRDLPHVVIVEVTVGVDGRTSDLRLSDPPGVTTPPELARLAIEALATAELRPATRGGVPRAVRIAVPVTLGQAPAAPGLRADRREPEPVPTVPEGVRGVVQERGTRRPVAGVEVVVTPLGPGGQARTAITDGDGRFEVRDLPRGDHRVEVPFFDEAGARARVTVPGATVLRVTSELLSQYRTRVGGGGQGAPLTDAARVRIPVERAREVPGSAGDPLKVLEVLPGVARPAAAGPGAGELAVRGSAPEDTKVFLDGLPLFQLYHFGNIYSVLQDAWVDSIDFRAGGYSTGFGDALGGIVDVTLAELPADGAHGHLDVNVYHVAGLVTVPVSDTWTLGAALRRSWVDAILGGIVGDDVSFGTAPRYYDYQIRADHRPRDGTRLRLLALGSDDEVVVLGGGPDADDPDGSGFSLGRSFHQVQGTLELVLARDLGLSLGLATSYQQLRVSPGDQSFRLTFDPVTLRADLDWRAGQRLRVRGGLWSELTRFRVDLALPRPAKEGQVQLPGEVLEVFEAREDGFTGRLDGWGEAVWEAHEDVTLAAGVRLASWYGGISAWAPDWRLAAGWQALERTRLTLSGGMNHQAPAPDESAASIGNPDLSPERAGYVNLALEQRLGDVLSVELQGFWKTLDRLVVPTDGAGGDVPYDNAGRGTIVGGEALVRLQHPIVDAWLAYTLSRSRRIDRPGAPERFFSFDQTHVLALVAGVQLGAGWRVGTRVRYATGNPFTPLEPAYFDAGADVWVPRAADAPLSRRSAAFFQLDLRVDKTFVFDTWRLELYLELNNATNRANIESIQYSDDYRRRDDITSLPLTPSLGVRGSF